MKAATSSRPCSEMAASCRAAIQPSVRLLEGLHLLGGEPHAGRLVEVGGGLAGAEPQVGRADLDQLAAHPPPGQRQVGVGPRAEHDVHVRREVLDQEGQAPADLLVAHQVVVVEHQPHLVGHRGELVEQRGQRRVGRGGRGPQQLQRRGRRRPARRRRRAVTTPVQNDTGSSSDASSDSHATRRSSVGRPEPGGEQGRLAEPRRGRHQRQPAVAAQPVDQPRAGHQAAAQAGDVELGRHQRSRHVSSTTTVSSAVPHRTRPGSTGRRHARVPTTAPRTRPGIRVVVSSVRHRHPVRNREAGPAGAGPSLQREVGAEPAASRGRDDDRHGRARPGSARRSAPR